MEQRRGQPLLHHDGCHRPAMPSAPMRGCRQRSSAGRHAGGLGGRCPLPRARRALSDGAARLAGWLTAAARPALARLFRSVGAAIRRLLTCCRADGRASGKGQEVGHSCQEASEARGQADKSGRKKGPHERRRFRVACEARRDHVPGAACAGRRIGRRVALPWTPSSRRDVSRSVRPHWGASRLCDCEQGLAVPRRGRAPFPHECRRGGRLGERGMGGHHDAPARWCA
mmetsp:Transcript_46561/g.129396  ORF Transcript_46561/g.129396 Transcript_46561/m.129396 type:complete len:228 (-) Transcript_46561:43-726(-)